jgi:hypothetical protein
MMFYLIYVSTAAKSMNNDELLSLLQQSRKNNLELGITGMLLYMKGHFMQMLEGEKSTVQQLYEEIVVDDRHRDVYKIMAGEIEKRNFDNWSMGFCNMEKAGDYPDLEDYIKENLTLKSFHNDSQRAFRYIVSFNNVNRLGATHSTLK